MLKQRFAPTAESLDLNPADMGSPQPSSQQRCVPQLDLISTEDARQPEPHSPTRLLALKLSSSTARIFHCTSKMESTAPISDATKQCIAFLATVEDISISDTTTDGNGDSCLVLNVTIADSPAAKGMADVALAAVAQATADSNNNSAADTSSSTTLQILRTFKEFKELYHTVEQWSKKHESTAVQHDTPECSYCQHFSTHEAAKLWPGGTLARLTMSKSTIEQKFEIFVNDYVTHARLPRPSERKCEGYEHIPAIIARFLIKELPIPI